MLIILIYHMERQGFEPWKEEFSLTIFEIVPFNHSGISPQIIINDTY